MGRVVATGDVERRGLRLLVRLLHDAEPTIARRAVVEWIDEAKATLRSSGSVTPSLEETLDGMAPVVDDDGWKATAIDQLVALTEYVGSLGDLEIRLRGGRAFISYVREDAATVERLVEDLRFFGIEVWLDRDDLRHAAGMEWRDVLRSEIEAGCCFIACCSTAWAERQHTYADEEVAVALAHVGDTSNRERWFFPVELARNCLPDEVAGAERQVADFQSVALYDDWYGGVIDIADAILPPTSTVRLLRDGLFDHDPEVRREGARDVLQFGDERQLIPLLRMADQQFALLDGDPDGRSRSAAMVEDVLRECARALGRFGHHDARCADRALPIYLEMLDRGICTYKVEEIMGSQSSSRVRSFAEALTRAEAMPSDLLQGDDPLAIDLDELRRRAEQREASIRRYLK